MTARAAQTSPKPDTSAQNGVAPEQPISLPSSLTQALLEAGSRDAAFMARLQGYIEGAGLIEQYMLALSGPLVLVRQKPTSAGGA